MDDTFFTFPPQRKYVRWRAIFIGAFTFIVLSLVTVLNHLQWHGFTLALSSTCLGYGVFSWIQTGIKIRALKPYTQNRSKKDLPPSVHRALKKLGFTLLRFFCAIGGALFFFRFFFWQQPESDVLFSPIDWDTIFCGIFFTGFLSLLVFTFAEAFMRQKILKIRDSKQPKKMPAFMEEDSFRPIKIPETDINPKFDALSDWEHSPLNPASPEYQSTGRYWTHSD